VNVKVYQANVLVDESSIEYSCDSINSEACSDSSDYLIEIITGIGFLILLILLIMLFKKKTKNIELVVIAFVIFAGFVFSTETTEAKGVSWNTVLEQEMGYFWSRFGGPYSGWSPGLVNPNVTVSYDVEINDKETGAVISDGDNVPVGSNLTLKFTPHEFDDIYWFGTGYSTDSPYGEWSENAEPGPVTCEDKDFVSKAHGWNKIDVYVPLVLDYPDKTFTASSNLSCSTLQGNESTGYIADCIVIGEGPVTVNFNFSQTAGDFYYRYYDNRGGLKGCYGNNIAMKKGTFYEGKWGELKIGNLEQFSLNVPSQNIQYLLSATPSDENQPPNPPTIDGPTNGSQSTSYEFSFVTSDPDDDQIKYGVDWDNDNTVDQWLPSSGLVDSGILQSSSKSWLLGTHTFKALAQDSNGVLSDWSSHTIDINESSSGETSVSCLVSPSPAGIGQDVLFRARINGGNGESATYTWTNTSRNDFNYTGSQFTRSYNSEDVYIYQLDVEIGGRNYTDNCGVTVSDANPSSNGPEPTIINFDFDPGLVVEGGKCVVVLDTTNVDLCSLSNGEELPSVVLIKSDDYGVDPGTYTVTCSNSSGESVTSDPQKCIGNFNIIES
jgi:hypothetical protein